jgi:hypothetical protein
MAHRVTREIFHAREKLVDSRAQGDQDVATKTATEAQEAEETGLRWSEAG